MVYTLAFVFDSFEEVALILKNRPLNLAGKYNGIGGKVEQDETPRQAAMRELKEEADLTPLTLVEIGTYEEPFFKIHVFYGYEPNMIAKTLTDETVSIFKYSDVHQLINLDEHARLFLNLAYLYHRYDSNIRFNISNNPIEDDSFGF